MVDFNKLLVAKHQTAATDPIEIFRRLPKPPGINDLYTSQAEVLRAWDARRQEQDTVIKLHTGGGKTLVGLLIAQALMNETREPVLYLSPNRQLVQQTLLKAAEYSIPAVGYTSGSGLPEDFLAARRILVVNYHTLFNGLSKFGVQGTRSPLDIGGIVLDDAHVAFPVVREAFTLAVTKEAHGEDYSHLTAMFRDDFQQIGKLGTFDDIVGGLDKNGVLEVPYWAWRAKSPVVLTQLRGMGDAFPFQWPFLRDAFDYCHCLVSERALTITPFFPLVDMLPSFARCKRRVFMSATIANDSELIRTFAANRSSIAAPITSKSLAGVGERMVLIPATMAIQPERVRPLLENLLLHVVDDRDGGAVVLTPSRASAGAWVGVATLPETTEQVAEAIEGLQSGSSRGPYVFANRYDGIDLPGASCRLLILDRLPGTTSDYEQFRALSLEDGVALTAAIAQRVEQGMGRGSRGAGDYCLVILTGRSLVAWLGRNRHLAFLTSSTRAQLQMGEELGKAVADERKLLETVEQFFARDRGWVTFHATRLASLTDEESGDDLALVEAEVERNAFRLWRESLLEKALMTVTRYAEQNPGPDVQSKGWLLQFGGRIAHYWGREDTAQSLQRRAYSANHNLTKPVMAPAYVVMPTPGEQTAALMALVARFGLRRALLSEFEEVVSFLTADASANQFEQSLARLGEYLGFRSERPDNTYSIGPDVLWLMEGDRTLVIEAKSRKKPENPLTKEEHGQLLNAVEWFKALYPGYTYIPVSAHPNTIASRSVALGEARALTLTAIQRIVANARLVLTQLVDSAAPDAELAVRCTGLLEAQKLRPAQLEAEYLIPFEGTGR